MKDIENKLNLIERRLQALIEGSSSKLFQSKDRFTLLNKNLIFALKESEKREVNGEIFAPDNFVVRVNPDQVDEWLSDQGTLESTAIYLRQYSREEGIRFESTPMIKVEPDPHIAPGDIRIDLYFRGDNITQTTAISIDEEQSETEIPSDAYLIVDGIEIFTCDQPIIKIGRYPENQLVIDDKRVSRQHAQIRAINGNFVLFDLNSSGGTFVNGDRINQRVLHPGDVISLAGVPLVYGQEKSAQENTQQITIDF